MANPKPFDWKRLDSILQYHASLVDCEELMEVSDDTVRRRIRDKFDMTFEEYRNKKLAPTRMKLRQKALDMAFNKDNVPMLIFCLKNICHWADNVQATHEIKPIQLKYNLDD